MSYNDYLYTKPIEVRGGIRAGSKRGAFGSSWWAKRWLQTLEEFQIGSRLDRGPLLRPPGTGHVHGHSAPEASRPRCRARASVPTT